MLIVAALLAILGLTILLIAYLASHRTPLPKPKRPIVLWASGVILLVAAGGVGLAPSFLSYQQCESACEDALFGKSTGGEGSMPNMHEDYQSCVKSSKKHRTEELVKQSQQDPPLVKASEIDGLVAAAEPDIQTTCRDLLMDRCVVSCYGAGV